MLDDGTDLTEAGPVCVDSIPRQIDPEPGSLLLSLRNNFTDTSDEIRVIAAGLYLQREE
ncbi:MAG: hypothetical protein ACHBMF_09225 [Chromatiales bacterium]